MFAKPLCGLLAVFAVLAVTGCASDPVDLHPTAAPTVNTVLPRTTTLDTTPLHIHIPADPGLQPAADPTVGQFVQVPTRFFVDRQRHMRHLVTLEQRRPDGFVVHARQDNGTSGSGIRYTVATRHHTAADGSQRITFTPQQRSPYQEGLTAQYPLPRMESPQLRQHLRSFTLGVQWQFALADRPAVVAQRLQQRATVRRNVQGEAAPLPAGDFVQHFQLRHARQPVNYTVTLRPAGSGTLALVQLQAPAIETAPHTVDFGAILPALRTQLHALLAAAGA